MLETMHWDALPRTYRVSAGGFTADVWRVGGQGWCFTIRRDKDGVYMRHGEKYPTCVAAQLAAEGYLKP